MERVYSNHYANVLLTRDAQISPYIFAWAVKLQKEIMDTHQSEYCVSWEHFSKSSYTPDFQHYLSAPLLILMKYLCISVWQGNKRCMKLRY